MNSYRIVLASASPRRIEIFRNHGLDPKVIPAEVDETLPPGIKATDAVMFLALKKALHVEQKILKLTQIESDSEAKTPGTAASVTDLQNTNPTVPVAESYTTDISRHGRLSNALPRSLDFGSAETPAALPNSYAAAAEEQMPVLAAPVLVIAADTVVVFRDRILGKPADEKEAFAMLSELRNSQHTVATGVAVIEAGKDRRSVFYDETKVTFSSYSDEEIWQYIATEEPMDKAGSYAIQGGFGKYVEKYEGSLENIIGFPWEKFCKEISLRGYI